MTPTRMAEQYLQEAGWITERCEHFAFGRRHDLFGFADLIAYKAGRLNPTVALIQVTTASNLPARRRKIEQNEHANRLALVMDIVVMGWKDGIGWKTQRYKGKEWLKWGDD